ncbi:MAG: KH domain-containing protein [Candidatus Dormibacteraeota bacterium]|uniref:RNA-binding protein KhpB n=2 Tax=Candidatus Aeolococcus gillhamiae TaxID=3127015 RepID=A0A934JVN3_9BACT|nr:KH domain-containing protein [Candidatus Dormibacteraeota bacterium]
MNETEEGTVQATAAPGVEGSGATVEEATAQALAELGAQRDDVVVEVLTRGGARPVPGEYLSSSAAKVRVSRIDEHTARGRALLAALLEQMEIPARVSVRRGTSPRAGEAEAPMILEVSGDDLGLLIGWRGETLRALQTTVNLMMGDEQSDVQGRRLILDVERYRARREDQVRELAQRLADRVKASGERYTLDPMHAYERRIIHLTLQDDTGVRTESSGHEPARRVVIHPTGPAQGGLPSRPERGRNRW